jgi:hypothetical protein
VDDDAPGGLSPNQMRKSDFLAQLRGAVCDTAEAALAGTIWSAMGCPWIDRWFDYYGDRSGQQIERAIRKYAPLAADAATAGDYIPIVCERVRQAIGVWADTGEVTGVPEEFADQVPGDGFAGAATLVGAGVASVGAGLAQAAGGIVSGIGSVFSSIGGLFAKSHDGDTPPAADPQATQQRLGAGHAIDGGVRQRMETAFGVSFADVRAHTDAKAAVVSDDLNARAFTVGSHVAFGAGEYRPGTPTGDALIAHELAHIVQQRGGASDGGASYGTLEAEADRSAVGAVLKLWSGAPGAASELAGRTLPALRSGLRLQSCKGEGSKAVPKEPQVLIDFAAKFSAAADIIRKDTSAMKLITEADAAGAKFGGYAEDGPGKMAWPYTIAATKTVYIPKARTDDYVIVSDFLFELNNAIRSERLAGVEKEALKGSKGKLTAKDYAYKKVEIEVEGMLRTGEVWFNMKAKLGTDPKWDKYAGDFFLAEYKEYKDGKKSKDDIIKDVLNRSSSAAPGKTTEQMYMDQYNDISGGK